MLLFLVIQVLHNVWKVTETHDISPCSNFFELSYASRRDPNVGVDSSPICDRWLTNGWYRVKYSTMVTTAPTINKCGTAFPIWMQGQDPTSINTTKSVKACQVGFSGPCELSYSIKAIRCPNNDVLYFLQSSMNCNAAYCFEKIDDCVKEPVSKVEAVYHKTSWEKRTSTVAQEYYYPIIIFFCNFTLLSNDNLLYDIEWYAGDVLLKNLTIDKNSIDRAVLSSEDMIQVNKKVGEKIRCVVGAKKSLQSPSCSQLSSKPFTVGFEVLNSTVSLQKNGIAHISIKQNIPYVVQSFSNGNTETILYIDTKYKDLETVACKPAANYKNCAIAVKGIDFKSRNNIDSWNVTHTLTIQSLDPVKYYENDHRLILSLGTRTDGNMFFSNVDLPDIHINIVDDIHTWEGKRCSSYADPHMKTFDGFEYECHKGGCASGTSYILYENEQHRQEAQVRHGSCWGRPQCVCAVAARSGRDLFIIDVCNGREFIEFPLCDDKSLQVHRESELIYRVVYPTGTSLKATIYDSSQWSANLRFWFIDVEIYPTIADFESTRGLCGFLDNKTENDLTWKNGFKDDILLYNRNIHPDGFSSSWGLNDTDDLLSHNRDIYNKLEKLANYTQKLCRCNVNGTVCSYKHYQECKTDLWGPELACKLLESKRKRRDVRMLQDMYSLYQKQNQSKRYRRQATKSQVEAISVCKSAFENAKHYKICLNYIPNFSNETLENCILDLMMTGDENLTQLHVETALGQCKEYIFYNSSLQKQLPDIVYNITAFCPKNCSSKGVCNEGECTCVKGFGGKDCSFDISSPPTVTRISDDGLCDKSTETCDEMRIYGKYFVSNPNASCVLKRYEYNTSGMPLNEEMYTYQVELREKTLFESSCSLMYEKSDSWFSKFVLKLTNDGVQFTEEYTMFVYQSECQIFKNESGNINISLQESYCFIEGACVSEGNLKTDSSCLVCDPQTDAYNWSNGFSARLQSLLLATSSTCTISDPEKIETNDLKIIAVVGGCIGLIVLLLTVIFVTVVFKQKISKSNAYSLSNSKAADFNIYPNRQTISKKTFNPKASLFALTPLEKSSCRPSSATTSQK